METRPLSLKNCDNKLIVSANILALEPQYRSITHEDQNGFVTGRNFLKNLVDIDAAGRIYSTKYVGTIPDENFKPDFSLEPNRLRTKIRDFRPCPKPHIYSNKITDHASPSECARARIDNIPIICPCDFQAAFPSVSHRWIWRVLEHRKIPASFLVLFKAMYKDAMAVTITNGVMQTIICFFSGVLQGCPGSALLFNNSLDPLSFMFKRKLEGGRKGIIRACADDLTFALSRLSHIRLLHPTYVQAETLAGLSLKPKKCKVVPLAPP